MVGTTWRKYWNAKKAVGEQRLPVSCMNELIDEARTILGNFDRVVKRLSNVREIWSKRELGDDMRKVHF